MPHIALVTTSYPTSHDGSEAAGSFVADFAQALTTYAQVTVIAPSLSAEVEQHKSLTLWRFKVPRLPLSLLKPYNPLDWLAIIKTLRAGFIALEQVAQQSQIDHIFALWALPSGYWAKSIGDTYNIPYSTWALGSDIWSLGKVPVIKTLLKKVLKASHTNFADGYLLKQSVESISGRNCHFLPSTRALNISKQKQLSTNPPPYRLAFLGRWHPNKGTDLLVESLRTLSDTDWQRIEEIRICGGGLLEKTIESAHATLKAQGHPIVLQGYLNKTEAIELFLWADYVLIPSRIESIPVVFSDAMKCQCPIVSMPVGDLPRLVTEYQVGVLAADVSAQAFGSAISQILQQSPQTFVAGLEQAADDFSLEHSVETLLTLTSMS